jgi:hypothetical protein
MEEVEPAWEQQPAAPLFFLSGTGTVGDSEFCVRRTRPVIFFSSNKHFGSKSAPLLIYLGSTWP